MTTRDYFLLYISSIGSDISSQFSIGFMWYYDFDLWNSCLVVLESFFTLCRYLFKHPVVFMLISFALQFIEKLEKHPDVLMSKASVTHRGNNLYMQAPPVLEEMTRSNLNLALYDLLGKVAKDTVHVSGMTEKNGKRSSSLRKLRVSFKGVSAGPTDMDTR